MTMDRNSRPEKPGRDSNSVIVLSVECLKGSSTADEWTGDMLQTGDIVEEILIGSGSSLSGSRSIRYKAPFKNGKSGVQKILHKSFKNKETSIVVRVRRGRDEFTELHACVVPESGYKNKYVLRSIEDPNYAVGFTDRSEAECFELQDFRYYKKHGSPTRISPLQECMFKSQNQSPQESYSVENFTGVFKYQWNRKPHEIFFNDGFSAEILSVFFKANRIFTVVDDVFQFSASRSSRIVSALQRAKLQDGYVAYPWEKKMQEYLLIPTSSSFLSLLLLPKASDRVASRYNDLEDTLARAHAWLYASQASGVPIVFMNIQTESLLTKISGETASSTVNAGSFSDLSRLAHVSLYGFEDYHGVDLGVVRAVRLWYAPLCGEFAIEVKIKEDDTKLGFAISRTEEGFIYVSSVMDDDDNAPSTRSGLSNLYKEATSSSRLLVVSRLSNQKVLPWMVSSTGAVRCFDTVSLSQKLSLHRHAKVPILIHVLLWDGTLPSPPSAGSTGRFRSVSPPVMALPPEIQLARQPSQNQIQPLPAADIPNDAVVGSEADIRLDRDTAGETSFRFDYFSLPNNWV